MVGKKVLLHLALLLATAPIPGWAQSWGTNPELNALADNMVKSLNEFMHRFNADEVPPFIVDDSSGNLRRKCVISLFDLHQVPEGESALGDRIMRFVDSVLENNIRLDITTPGIYAEARSLFKHKGKSLELNLVMVYDNYRDDYWRWTLAGANGLVEAGLVDTSRSGYISPTNHAVGFTELGKAFPKTTRYWSPARSVDQLSYISALSECGSLQFDGCQEIVYYFTQVPGYVFSVTMHPRQDINTGWLIHDLVELPNEQKRSFITQLLGK